MFSLLDPYVFRLIIDNYVTKFAELIQCRIPSAAWACSWALRLASPLFLASQKTSRTTSPTSSRSAWARRCMPTACVIRLELPYAVFEDQRSGETLGKLQKARTDSEKFLNVAINVLFISLVGVIFVMIFAVRVHWLIAVVYFLTIPVLLSLMWTLSAKIKRVQKDIFKETAALAGATTESCGISNSSKASGWQGRKSTG